MNRLEFNDKLGNARKNIKQLSNDEISELWKSCSDIDKTEIMQWNTEEQIIINRQRAVFEILKHDINASNFLDGLQLGELPESCRRDLIRRHVDNQDITYIENNIDSIMNMAYKDPYGFADVIRCIPEEIVKNHSKDFDNISEFYIENEIGLRGIPFCMRTEQVCEKSINEYRDKQKFREFCMENMKNFSDLTEEEFLHKYRMHCIGEFNKFPDDIQKKYISNHSEFFSEMIINHVTNNIDRSALEYFPKEIVESKKDIVYQLTRKEKEGTKIEENEERGLVTEEHYKSAYSKFRNKISVLVKNIKSRFSRRDKENDKSNEMDENIEDR